LFCFFLLKDRFVLFIISYICASTLRKFFYKVAYASHQKLLSSDAIILLIFSLIDIMVFITFTVAAFLLTGVGTGILSCALYGLIKQFGDLECEMERRMTSFKIAQGG